MSFTKFATDPMFCANRSWVSSGVALGNSPIHGFGLFAEHIIPAGQLVVNLRGIIFTLDDVKSGRAWQDSVTGFEEGLYLGRPPLTGTQTMPIEDFLNHSCDPTLW